jgi:hypothetical protein
MTVSVAVTSVRTLLDNYRWERTCWTTIDEREEFPSCHFLISPDPISKPGFLSHPFLTNLCPYSKMSTYCRMQFSYIHSVSRCIIVVILRFSRQYFPCDAEWKSLTLWCKMAITKFLLIQPIHFMWRLLTLKVIIFILLLKSINTVSYNSGEEGRKKVEENNLWNCSVSYFT